MSAIRRLVEVVQQADQFKQQQLAAIWPELAEAVAGVIESTTDQCSAVGGLVAKGTFTVIGEPRV